MTQGVALAPVGLLLRPSEIPRHDILRSYGPVATASKREANEEFSLRKETVESLPYTGVPGINEPMKPLWIDIAEGVGGIAVIQPPASGIGAEENALQWRSPPLPKVLTAAHR